jgi:hypothetical protein
LKHLVNQSGSNRGFLEQLREFRNLGGGEEAFHFTSMPPSRRCSGATQIANYFVVGAAIGLGSRRRLFDADWDR